MRRYHLLKIILTVLLLCGLITLFAEFLPISPAIYSRHTAGDVLMAAVSTEQQPVAQNAMVLKRQIFEPAEASRHTNDEAQPKPYTIAWISDTQHYSSGSPDTFLTMTRYIKENSGALNIGYVVHTGDIVSDGTSVRQWENAKRAMDELKFIPHGVLAGNHDVGSKINYSNFCKYFGEEQFAGNSYYGGSMLNNRNHFDLLTLGNTQYIFVYLGYQPEEESIAWANTVFKNYADRVGVLCVHDYINTDSSLRGMGKILREQVVMPNPNVFMVLCGHRYTEDCLMEEFDDNGDGSPDRTVYQCIANYQNLENGGNGYIRFIRVDEARKTLQFYTYSPLLDAYRSIPEKAKNQSAVLPVPWTA